MNMMADRGPCCSIHFEADVLKSKALIQFTPKTTETAVEKAQQWVVLCEPERSIARKLLDLRVSTQFYHVHCYTKFTLQKRINSASTRLSASVASSDTQTRILRSSSTLASILTSTNIRKKAAHLFPELCVICSKERKWIFVQGKKQRDKLVLCQTDGKTLYEAAIHQNAEHVLRYLRCQDPAAYEIRYHKSCYRSFTKADSASNSECHSTSQDCDGKAACSSTFQNFVQDLDFDTEPYLDFSENNSCSDITEGSSDTTDMMDSDMEVPFQRDNVTDLHDVTSALFRGAVALRYVIKSFQKQSACWPPTAESFTLQSFKEEIPSLLYNFLAWTCDLTEDDLQSEPVTLMQNKQDCEQKLCSLAHDLMGLTRREVFPKQLMLSVTARHITGSKRLVDVLNGLGHGASYSSILEYETALAELEMTKSVSGIPSLFRKSVPATFVWDNNDFCEETMTGQGTTHCTTGIIIQRDVTGFNTISAEIPKNKRTFKRSLVSPNQEIVSFKKPRKQQPVIQVTQSSRCTVSTVPDCMQSDISFALDLAYYICKAMHQNPSPLPDWTGFNSAINIPSQLPISLIGYLPLIDANPTDMNTINTVLSQSVRFADELCLPSVVLVMDQAMYSKAQEIRWNDEQLKQRLVLRLGEFHTCMCLLAVLGKRYRDAGLEDVMIESGVVASGSISGVMTGHHYNRSVRAHKIVAESMSRLCWNEFLESMGGERRSASELLSEHLVTVFLSNPTSFEGVVMDTNIQSLLDEFSSFVQERLANPTFHFWWSYIKFVCLLQQFIRATRRADWELHLLSVKQIIPLCFAYDRINYARFLPCYLAEMENLQSTHPDIEQQLKRGDFSVQRQHGATFSQTACDQVIEQTINRHTKTQGGLIGKTRKKGAVRRWILSSHSRAQITSNCENIAGGIGYKASHSLENPRKSSFSNLHEQQVKNVVQTIQRMINPFLVSGDRIINISSGVVADRKIEDDLIHAYKKGQEAFDLFQHERLASSQKSIFAPMKCLKLNTFANQGKAQKYSSTANTSVTLKASKALLSRMLHLGKVDSSSLKETLTHALVPVPPCLGHYDGSLVKTNKAKLLQVFDVARVDNQTSVLRPPCALIIDGMAVIQSTNICKMHTFSDLSEAILSSIIECAFHENADRLDFVLDTYRILSIKNDERSRRASAGVSVLKIVNGRQPLPKQWKKYLANSDNKTNLCEYLFKDWSLRKLNKIKLFITQGKMCFLLQEIDGLVMVNPVMELISDHEEADTRLFLHAMHASITHKAVSIRSPDTDVAIIAASVCDRIDAHLCLKQSNEKVLDFEAVKQHLSTKFRLALIGLHVFTGCDSVSAFSGKGKLKALKIMQSEPDFEYAFCELGENWMPGSNLLTTFSKFVCHLYGKKNFTDVNSARYSIFCQGTTNDKAFPPTQDCLNQHILRANYQAGLYRRCLQQNIIAPSPDKCGWELQNNELNVTWMTQPVAPENLLSVVGCKCKKKMCVDNSCSCRRNGISCSEACACFDCLNDMGSLDDLNDINSDIDSDVSDAEVDSSTSEEE